ncbi:MAG: alpha/beta fold hydrolase, partial [Planctomycetales bacterium]|nr:alpha/beta fold hydrolase [Planctomycetales bacterium]
IAVDHMGCGKSDKPQNYDYSLATHIHNLKCFIAQLDLQNITLVGHDWGGAIGLGAAVEMPERFERFVMLNTGAFPPTDIPWRIRVCRTPLIGPSAVRALNLFSLAALLMAVERPGELSQQFVDGILAPYDSWANRVAVNAFVQDIPSSPEHPTWHVLANIEAKLQLFRDLPFSLIWGMRDWCFKPQCMERFAELLPQAEKHPISDAGHWVVEEAKNEVAQRIGDFLKRTS